MGKWVSNIEQESVSVILQMKIFKSRLMELKIYLKIKKVPWVKDDKIFIVAKFCVKSGRHSVWLYVILLSTVW